MLNSRHSRQRGYCVVIGPDGMREIDSVLCEHCGKNIWTKPARDPADFGARCTICDSFICSECRDRPCATLEYRLDQYERRGQGLRYDRREDLFDIFEKSGKIIK